MSTRRTPPKDSGLLERAVRGIVSLKRQARQRRGRSIPPASPHAAVESGRSNASWAGSGERGKLEEAQSAAPRPAGHDLRAASHVGDPRRACRGSVYVRHHARSSVHAAADGMRGTSRRTPCAPAQPARVFDEKTGRVVSGYTIVQPRIETSPSSLRDTRFSRIFAGEVGLDIYPHTVSDAYLRTKTCSRRGSTWAEGHLLRRRRVHAQHRGTGSGERTRKSRPVRGHPRANGPRHRHRPVRGISGERRHPREAAAQVGARRLAAAALAALQGAIPGRGGGRIRNPLLLI